MASERERGVVKRRLVPSPSPYAPINPEWLVEIEVDAIIHDA